MRKERLPACPDSLRNIQRTICALTTRVISFPGGPQGLGWRRVRIRGRCGRRGGCAQPMLLSGGVRLVGQSLARQGRESKKKPIVRIFRQRVGFVLGVIIGVNPLVLGSALMPP